jgi:hypothetical protein
MSETIYNLNWKQKGLPMSYSRKRSNAYLDPFVSKKHIQNTNRVSSSHYIDVKGAHIGSKEVKNGKHGSYDRYLRELKSPIIKSKGNKTGIVKGCKCGSEPELTYNAKTIDITYDGPVYNNNINVYAIKGSNTYYEEATITLTNTDGTYNIIFNSDSSSKVGVNKNELEPFFGKCKCGMVKNGKIFISDPTKIGECGGEISNDYFMQMGGYFKRIKCL